MDCEHPVRLYGLCAICGKDVSAKWDFLEELIVCSDEETSEGQNVHILHTNIGLTVARHVFRRLIIDPIGGGTDRKRDATKTFIGKKAVFGGGP
jgi:DNA-directed RNA polymerase subunit N (RpoN/RPB10)